MPPTTHTAPPDDLAHSIKGLMAAIEPNGPGAAVLVVHDGAEFYSRPALSSPSAMRAPVPLARLPARRRSRCSPKRPPCSFSEL